MTEVPQLRTANTKTFQLPSGAFRVITKRKIIHYLKNGQWEDINTDIKAGDICDTLPFTFELKPLGFQISANGESTLIKLRSVGGVLAANLPINTQNKTRVRNEIWFNDFLPSIDIGFVVNPQGVRTIKRLKSATAPRVFVWNVTQTGGEAKFADAVGRDNENELETADEPKRRLLEIITTRSSPVTVDNVTTFRVTETWTGKVFLRDPITRVMGYTDNAIYPVTLDPSVSYSSTSIGDSGDEIPGVTWNDRYYRWYWGRWSGATPFNGAVRFTGVAVPQGATITSATLTMTEETRYNTGAKSTCRGEAADNPPAWSSSSLPSAMTPTTASANAVDSGGATTVITVTTIVQELVNRAGWVSGNAMRFAFLGDASVNASVGFDGRDPAGNETVFDITYTTSSTSIKTWDGLADASTKTYNGLARASIKTFNGLA
jgi:hypothetical protein